MFLYMPTYPEEDSHFFCPGNAWRVTQLKCHWRLRRLKCKDSRPMRSITLNLGLGWCSLETRWKKCVPNIYLVAQISGQTLERQWSISMKQDQEIPGDKNGYGSRVKPYGTANFCASSVWTIWSLWSWGAHFWSIAKCSTAGADESLRVASSKLTICKLDTIHFSWAETDTDMQDSAYDISWMLCSRF